MIMEEQNATDKPLIKISCLLRVHEVEQIDAICSKKRPDALAVDTPMCVGIPRKQSNCQQLHLAEREHEERNPSKAEMNPEKEIKVVVLGTTVERVVTLDDLISTGDSYQIDLHTYGGLGSHEYNLSVDSEPQIAEKIRLGQIARAGWDQE